MSCGGGGRVYGDPELRFEPTPKGCSPAISDLRPIEHDHGCPPAKGLVQLDATPVDRVTRAGAGIQQPAVDSRLELFLDLERSSEHIMVSSRGCRRLAKAVVNQSNAGRATASICRWRSPGESGIEAYRPRTGGRPPEGSGRRRATGSARTTSRRHGREGAVDPGHQESKDRTTR